VTRVPEPSSSRARSVGPGPRCRPDPPRGARNVVVVVLDSLRYDTCLAACPKTMLRLGDIERRFSYASWTAPSHYNLLMGLMPHTSPQGTLAADYYRAGYGGWGERLGIDALEFEHLVPELYLPSMLRNRIGYLTNAYVSMPVLNPRTVLNADFDRYELMPTHHDLEAMIGRLRFSVDRPSFHLLNVGETHYPYVSATSDGHDLPRVSGLNGAVRSMDDAPTTGGLPFSATELLELRDRQVKAASYTDDLLGALMDAVPPGTWVVVTADHGELFGEGGMFGHGPVFHTKAFEVPYVEGIRS
jgi:hypothetical protein